MPGLICAGNLYLDELDGDGIGTGFELAGNCTKFAIASSGEIKQRTSKQRDTYGQSLGSVTLPGGSTLSITLDEATAKNVARQFLGSSSALNVAAGSVTDEAKTLSHDKWARLANRNLTAGTDVLTSSDGITTYVKGTDYEVNERLGLVRSLSSGSIPDAADVLMDYDHGGVSGTRIAGAAKPVVRVAAMLDGKNLETQEDILVVCRDVSMTPDGETDLMASEWVPFTYSGPMSTPAGESSPYTVDMP